MLDIKNIKKYKGYDVFDQSSYTIYAPLDKQLGNKLPQDIPWHKFSNYLDNYYSCDMSFYIVSKLNTEIKYILCLFREGYYTENNYLDDLGDDCDENENFMFVIDNEGNQITLHDLLIDIDFDFEVLNKIKTFIGYNENYYVPQYNSILSLLDSNDYEEFLQIYQEIDNEQISKAKHLTPALIKQVLKNDGNKIKDLVNKDVPLLECYTKIQLTSPHSDEQLDYLLDKNFELTNELIDIQKSIKQNHQILLKYNLLEDKEKLHDLSQDGSKKIEQQFLLNLELPKSVKKQYSSIWEYGFMWKRSSKIFKSTTFDFNGGKIQHLKSPEQISRYMGTVNGISDSSLIFKSGLSFLIKVNLGNRKSYSNYYKIFIQYKDKSILNNYQSTDIWVEKLYNPLTYDIKGRESSLYPLLISSLYGNTYVDILSSLHSYLNTCSNHSTPLYNLSNNMINLLNSTNEDIESFTKTYFKQDLRSLRVVNQINNDIADSVIKYLVSYNINQISYLVENKSLNYLITNDIFKLAASKHNKSLQTIIPSMEKLHGKIPDYIILEQINKDKQNIQIALDQGYKIPSNDPEI